MDCRHCGGKIDPLVDFYICEKCTKIDPRDELLTRYRTALERIRDHAVKAIWELVALSIHYRSALERIRDHEHCTSCASIASEALKGEKE